MRRLLLIALFVTSAAVGVFFWLHSRPIARAGWLVDYEALRLHTQTAYANFADRAIGQRLNFQALDARTRARLDRAQSAAEARATFTDFVAAFADGHFQARVSLPPWRRWLRRLTDQDPSMGRASLLFSTPGPAACTVLGYQARRPGPIAWSTLPGWTPLAGDAADLPFSAGYVPREAGRPPLAVLRIPLFSGETYPALCAKVWDAWRAGKAEACAQECQDDFSLTVENALVASLAAEAEALAARADTLVVDLTHNSGGSSVVDPMMRTLTPVKLRQPAYGFIRHPHWAKQFTAAEAEFTQELQRTDLAPALLTLLESARVEARRCRKEAVTSCDLSSVWSQPVPMFPCRNLARSPGYLSYAAPGALDGLATKGRLFNPSQYHYREGAWRGKLVVLTDAWTASSAEEFAAVMKDNGAATLAGQPTLGSGCGYTNGGVTLELPHVEMTVRAPDCARYRADGSNEAAPIIPDLPVDWSPQDDGPTRARKVIATLAQ